MQVLVRKHNADDLPFIFDSYLKSWRTSKWAGTIPNNLYFETQRTLLEDLIGRGAQLRVAYPEGHEDIILGWGCGEVKEERAVVHYIYIKDTYAGFEVADKILAELPGTKPGFVTHKMFLVSLRNWTHAPEIARRKSL